MREHVGHVAVHRHGGSEDDEVAAEKGDETAGLAEVETGEVGELGRWVGHHALRVVQDE